jgi:mRNA interferase MazF
MRRGEIYFVTLDPIIGHEQAGMRPVLVVSNDVINVLPTVVTVIPGTSGTNVAVDRPYTVRVPPAGSGLPLETVFLCYQIRALDHSRFRQRPSGFLSPSWMDEIEKALKFALDLPP